MRIHFPETKSKQEHALVSNNAQCLKSKLSWKIWDAETCDYRNLEGTRLNSSNLQV